jgi:GTPase-associated system helical domain
MTELLTELLAAGLIEKLEGNDERFAKLEKAASAVAQELRDDPPGLIRAILAGLDPDVTANDPAIARAEQALTSEWKSMRSVHPDPPIGSFRAILLEACSQAAERDKAAIVWLTAADTLQFLRLGKEEDAIKKMMEGLASCAEEEALVVSAKAGPARNLALKVAAPATVKVPSARKVDRNDLLMRVAAASGPNYKNNNVANPNPHWTNQPQSWSWEFSDRMSVLLANELDALAESVREIQLKSNEQNATLHANFAKSLDAVVASQQNWLKEALDASEAQQHAAQLRLDALWWSEALYSHSIRCSYRDLPPHLAAVVMAVDLLAYMPELSPASVCYLLAETVHRLPKSGFEQRCSLSEVLDAIRDSRSSLPKGWQDELIDPPAQGHLSLRDVILLSLRDQVWNLDALLKRTSLSKDVSLSLPILSRAFFRQEQAVRLAGSIK